jgi:hypothetical protein
MYYYSELTQVQWRAWRNEIKQHGVLVSCQPQGGNLRRKLYKLAVHLLKSISRFIIYSSLSSDLSFTRVYQSIYLLLSYNHDTSGRN